MARHAPERVNERVEFSQVGARTTAHRVHSLRCCCCCFVVVIVVIVIVVASLPLLLLLLLLLLCCIALFYAS